MGAVLGENKQLSFNIELVDYEVNKTTVAVNGVQTGDWDGALKEGVVAASEEFKWGAIGGAIGGGVFEAVYLKGATLNGLTPTNVNGKSTLIRDIDLDFKSELDGKTVTNLERMKKGRAAVDPLTGKHMNYIIWDKKLILR